VILASLWYIASHVDLSISTLKKMKTLVRDFVWSNQAKRKKGQNTYITFGNGGGG